MTQFLEDNPTKGAKRVISQSLELIEMNIGWLERNKNDITQCLQEFREQKTNPSEPTLKDDTQTTTQASTDAST